MHDQVLRDIKSYPELAALLGHEYSHIKHRHGMKALAQYLARDFLADIFSGDDQSEKFIKNANQLLGLKYSRALEREADKGAVELLIARKVDLQGMADLFKRMQKWEEANTTQIPEYLSTHPNTDDRLNSVEKEINEASNKFQYNEQLDRVFKEIIK